MAFLGKDSVLQLEISNVFTTVAAVVSIDGFNATVETVESTTLGSSAKSFLPSIPDYGEYTATIQYDPSNATHSALTDLIGTPVVASWKVILGNAAASVYAFDGILSSFHITGIENASVVQAEITIKVTDVVDITV